MNTAVALALSATSLSLGTQTMQPQSDAQGLRALAACRGIPDTQERLTCYDREALAVERAIASGDLVALDREEVSKTRRSLFGFSLPAIRLFSDRGDRPEVDRETVDNLSTTVKSARQLPRGRWSIELDEGGSWTQIDDRKLAIHPRPGQKIEIRRAALGSYLANINGQIAIRVRRTS